jgi:hypothetical protein
MISQVSMKHALSCAVRKKKRKLPSCFLSNERKWRRQEYMFKQYKPKLMKFSQVEHTEIGRIADGKLVSEWELSI